MKKIIPLLALSILLSSFFGDEYYSENSILPEFRYEKAFPHIQTNDASFSIYYPEDLQSVNGVDAASNKGNFKIWFENGRGNYFRHASDRNITGTTSANTKYDPCMFASVLYENPKRPPGSSGDIAGDRTATSSGETNLSPDLKDGFQVKLVQSMPCIVSEDPMTFCISYRFRETPRNDNRYRIILKFNQVGCAAGDVFINPEEGGMIDLPSVSPGATTLVPGADDANYSLKTNMIPEIRITNGEIPVFFRQGIPTAQSAASARSDGDKDEMENSSWDGLRFNNAVAFDHLSVDSGIHNIFVTLKTKAISKEIAGKNPGIFLEAVLQEKGEITLHPKSKIETITWKDVETSRAEDVAADAHDPNKVTVSPACIPLPQAKTKLKYRIDFENTGAGNADAVIVAFHAPAQVKIENYSRTGFACGTKTAGTISEVRDDAQNTITFRVAGLLEGVSATKPEASQGHIDFDLEVSPLGNKNQPEELTAWADIFFHSERGNPANDINQDSINAHSLPAITMGYEMPVTTDPARTVYREKCETGGCKCSSTCCWFCTWWWLLLVLLILLIFALWYFLRRRYRNRNAP